MRFFVDFRNSKESLDSAIEHAVEPSSRDLANAIKENKDNKENTDYKSMLHFFMTEKIDQARKIAFFDMIETCKFIFLVT